WLIEALRADVYVSAPAAGEDSGRRLDPEVVRSLLAVPAVRTHSESRRVVVPSPHGPLDVNAVRLAPESYAGVRFTQASATGALRAAARGRQALFIRSNADIRALSMRIFDRTFVITRVLYWLAAGVAAVGLVSALLASELQRSRELAVLRSLGLTPRGTALLVLA